MLCSKLFPSFFFFLSSFYLRPSSIFRHAVWSLRGSSASRLCTHPLLISCVNQGEKKSTGYQTDRSQLNTAFCFFLFSPHSHSPLPLPPFFSCQSLLHVRDFSFWSHACSSRPWAHLATAVSWVPCTVKLSLSLSASYPPSTHRRSTMLIWRKFIHYVMLS